ncbi:MAG: insulinase family protein, partial [Verrucomicrobiota bacterium]
MNKAPSTTTPPDLGALPEDPPHYGFFAESEAPYVSIGANVVTAYEPKQDLFENRQKRMILDMAYAMVNRRFEKRAKDEDAPFLGASVSKQSFFRFADVHGFNATTQAEDWEAAVAELEQAMRGAAQYGFTESELREVKARRINALEEAVARKGTRNSRSLAMGLIRAYENSRVILSPEDQLRLYKPFVESVTVDQVNAAFREIFSAADPRIFVSGKLVLEAESAVSEIESAWKASQKIELEAPVDEGEKLFAYSDFGAAGEIVATESIEALGVEKLTFANHVEVFSKQTDFKDNEIMIAVRIGEGMLSLGERDPALVTFASQTFSAGGLEAHSADEITSIFAGKNVGVGFEVGQDAFSFSASTTPDDLADTLNLLVANILYPGYRDEAVNVAKRYFAAVEQYIAHNAEGVMFDGVPKFLSSGDARFGWPKRPKLEALTMSDVKAWIQPSLDKDAIEVAIVGDFDPDALKVELARTFGAMEKRATEVDSQEQARQVSFPQGGQEKTFTFHSEQPKGIMLYAWPTEDMLDIQRARRLNMLSRVLRDRMRVEIREQLGEAYSPRASHTGSKVFEDYGSLTAQVVGDVEKIALIRDTVVEIAESLVDEGTNEDELGRVLKPTLTSLEEQLRNNSYWLYTVMSGATVYPDQLEWAKSIFDDYESIAVEDINLLAKEF